MMHLKYLRVFVLFTLILFTAIIFLGFLHSFYLYLRGIECYYKGKSARFKEILDLYFTCEINQFQSFILPIKLLMLYICSYIFFDWFVFNENGKIFSFLSKYFTFFSDNLTGKDKFICNHLCTLIIILMVGDSMSLYVISPIYHFSKLLITFLLLYMMPYRIFIFLFAIQLLAIASIPLANYYLSLTIGYAADKKFVPYDINDLHPPVRDFLIKKNFYNIYAIKEGHRYDRNAFSKKIENSRIIGISEFLLTDPDLQYILIHEYGHIYRNHSFKKILLFFLLEVISYGLFIIIAILLVRKTNYINLNKKLYFFAVFTILNMITLPTYIYSINCCASVYIEYEADKYAVESGFAYETAVSTFKLMTLTVEEAYESYFKSPLLYWTEYTHPTIFRLILAVGKYIN